VCMSSAPSQYETFLNNLIPCQAIYSREFEHGTLYGMHLKGSRSDAALDKRIVFLDSMLSECSPDKRTRFTSICNTPSLSGKIKTFANGTHGEDMHFKALFSSGFAGRRGLEALHGVRKWTFSGEGVVRTVEEQDDEVDEEIDISDQAVVGSSSRGKARASGPPSLSVVNDKVVMYAICIMCFV
jgi:hypothetical protein